MSHLSPMKLLPPKPGTCQKCAVDHEPNQPHDQQSLFWQYYFYGENGRWPTWKDAMSHCADSVKKLWKEELAKLGVAV